MTTITRDELHTKYTEYIQKINEKTVQSYVTSIQEKIFIMNEKGHKSYCYIFHKSCGNDENPEIIKEIVRRLQEIFVDSKVVFHERNAYIENQIVINWSLA